MRNLAPAVIALPILLLAAACGTKVDVPAPSAATTSLPLPEPAPSVVSIPISLTIDSVARKVERLVPKGQSREGDWHELGKFPVVGTVYVREKWERDPLRLSISGDRAEVNAHVRYRARIAERACLPLVGCRWVVLASCGHDGPMATLDVGLRTTVAWRNDWSVIPRTRPRPVRAGVRCRLTRANIDVTERVQEEVQKQLNRVAPQVDAEMRKAVALRSRVEDAWNEVQKPIRADDSVYVLLRPDSIAVAPPTASGARVTTVVTVRVRPQVVIGPRPNVEPLPLPNYSSRKPGTNRFRIVMTAELPYTLANELLSKAVVGQKLTFRDHTVTVKRAWMYGSGEGVVVGVRVAGDARGTLYFVGHPVYNAATREMSVPDLDFSVETRNVAGNAAGWLLHERLRDELRAAARFAVGDRIEKVRTDVDKALDRDLSRAVRLSGGVDAVRPMGVVVGPHSVGAVVEAEGHAQIAVTVR
jgi:hypothetical protein